MRIPFAPATLVLLSVLAVPAAAETKIFIVENHADGYGVDQCLASGSNCGKPVASAYCQSRQYGHAVSFRKVDPDEITGGRIGSTASCHSKGCGEYVAIECTR
jgi:hypothetical protein